MNPYAEQFQARIRVLVFVLITAASAAAQASPPKDKLAAPVSFEVASVRMVNSYSDAELQRGAGNDPLGSFPSDRFVARHVPLVFLISVAFDFDTAHVDPSEEWQDDQLYDIAATVPGNRQLTLEEMRPLLKDLLIQRFHLETHVQEKLTSGYRLIQSSSGAKLPSSSKGEAHASILPDRLWGRNVPIGMLAAMLERATGSPVRDETGFGGSYNIDLRFRREDDANSGLADIFTAVQEQLGLKLVPAKVPVKHLVIDDANRVPTEN